MRNKNFLSLFIILSALPVLLQAHPVEPSKAHIVANNFLKSIGEKSLMLQDITSTTPYSLFYTFATPNGKGFVLISADDCVLPVLGYSTTDPFVVEGMPENVRSWLDDYEQQILFYRTQESFQTANLSTSGDNPVASEWARLLSDDPTPKTTATAVAPLISTTWGQEVYYNQLCPYNSSTGANSPTGCVATATAQVMKYWNHPTTGYGSRTYTYGTYPTFSANFGATTYDWSNMPNALTSSSTTTEVSAVATLMLHVGIAVEMQYGTNASGAYTCCYGDLDWASAENALRTYFKYKPSLHQVAIEDYTTTQWNAMLTNELTSGRPILYSGRDSSSGHCFVLDGCNVGGQFHINWGWYGYCNGYYAIGSLNPTTGGTGGTVTSTYNLLNDAIIGIEPNNNFGSTTTVSVSSNNTAYGTVSGGGTYTGIGTTTVSLPATATAGCRFTGWSDGYKYNPRTFYANGGYHSFVANFEPLSGDTLGYSQNSCLNTLGYTSGTAIWGIKLPASTLSTNHSLTHVSLFVARTGSYTLSIRTGSTSPSTTVCNQVVSIPASAIGQWYTIPLSSPAPVDSTQAVWISFSYTDTANVYPATVSYSCGNSDALLWGSDLTPLTSWDYSFMIRGIFAEDTTYYTLTVRPNNSLMGSTLGSGIYAEGDTATISAIPNSGFHFLYWNDADTHASRSVVVSDNATFTATFAQDTTYYTLTVRPNDSLMGSTLGSGIYAEGDTATISAIPNSGFHFLYWNDADTHASRSVVVSDNATFTATFAQDTTYYTLTVRPNDSLMGSTLGSGIYAEGDTATISAIPNSGFHFLYWNDADTHASRSVVVSDNATFTATFAQDTTYYTLTVRPNDSLMGSTLGSGIYAEGDTATISAIPNSGFHFLYWNDADTHASRSVVVSDNATFTATFAQDTTYYTLTVRPNDSLMGSTLGSGIYAEGDTATISAIPNSGFHFLYWNDADTHASRSVVVSDNATYTATFAQDTTYYTLTVRPNDSLMGSTLGSGIYAEGDTATISAIPNSGFHFLYWNDADTHASRSVVVSDNATFTATFAQDQTEGIDNIINSITIANLPSNQILIVGIDGLEISVYDLMGRLVTHIHSAKSATYISLPHRGVYLVKIAGLPAKKVIAM